MAITMALNERRNHLHYVIALPELPLENGYEDSDGNVLLHKLFITRLSGAGAEAGASSRSSGVFGGPAKKGTLNTWQRRALRDYLENSDAGRDSAFDIDPTLNLPKTCLRWASYTPTYKNNGGYDQFTAISSTMRRSNSTRCSSAVIYIVKLRDGSTRTAFGEI